MQREIYESYIKILKEELLTAMGCTEPIAVAYAAALARSALGSLPERVEIAVSGNILKNVKSVIVPNTCGLKGVKAATAAGIIAGKPENKLQVLAELTGRLGDAVRNSVRRTDAVSKYGKGQYLVLLVNTTLEDCSIVQERINHQFISGFLKTGVQYYVNSVICFPDKKDMVLGQRK